MTNQADVQAIKLVIEKLKEEGASYREARLELRTLILNEREKAIDFAKTQQTFGNPNAYAQYEAWLASWADNEKDLLMWINILYRGN
jgi:hypothetical protein